MIGSSTSALNQGLQGIANSGQKLNQAANEIAAVNVPGSESDLVEPLTTLVVEEANFKASAKVVETASETLGTLLDVTA